MREYSKVEPKAWHGKTLKDLRKRGSEALLVGLYLMTSPSSNMLGLFSQPVLYMAHETGLGQEGTLKGLRWCIEAGFCAYDDDSEMVWVFEMARYQIAPALKESDLRCKGVQREYDALPENPFLGPFFDRYQAAFHLTNRRGAEGAYIGPIKALPSQEHEQEQEQEHEQDKQPGVAFPGFAEFWRAWPKSDRKQAKGECLKAWKKAGAEPHAALILAHVERMKASDDWRRDNGRYVPAPLVYLHQKRWDGAEGEEAAHGANGHTANGHAEEWWRKAGYANRWEAENDGCWPHTADQFRDGKPLRRLS